MAEDLSEVHDPPRPRTTGFYITLCLLIAPFWGFIPASWIFCIWSVYTGHLWTSSIPWRVAFTIATFEVLFSLYHIYTTNNLSSPPNMSSTRLKELQIALHRVLKAGMANLPPDGYDEESGGLSRPASPDEVIVQLEFDDPRAIDFRFALRTWFGRQRWSDIGLLPVRQWLYWAIFNEDIPAQIPERHKVALDEAVEALQKRCGSQFSDNTSSISNNRPLRLTVDPIQILWRPLSFYVFVAIVNSVVLNVLKQFFAIQHSSYNGMDYLLHSPPSWNPDTDPRPIVLLHGLGLGLVQYLHIILKLLRQFPDRPILVMLQPHISQDLFHRRFLEPLSQHETTDRLSGLIQELGWAEIEKDEKPSSSQGVTMLSHSNGSYPHAWMLKAHPEMITRSCFVDPVTFCSWEGDVCYNFLYKPCATAFELLMRYFVGRELGVANLLSKRFDWSANALWYEEIPNARDSTKTLFVVGGKDEIVNAPRVKKYLSSHGIKTGLVYHPTARHGEALASEQGLRVIFAWLREEHDLHDNVTKVKDM